MKGIAIFLVLVAAGMLVFGCTYSAQSSANYSTGGNATGAGASGGASDASAGGSGAGGSGETAPAKPQTEGSVAIDMAGKDYSDLIAAGSGSQCAVSYKSETGAPEELKIYFDGKRNMRMEQDTGYSDCPKAVIVFKGDSSGNGMLYLSCPGHNEEALGQKFGTHEQCVWQSMEIEEQWGGIGTSSRGLESGYSTPSLEYLSEPAYSCQQWALDGSKFETSGFVCD